MRWLRTGLMLGAFWAVPLHAAPQLQLVAGAEPRCVFAGRAQTISLRWRNSGNSAYETALQQRIMQLTSAPAVFVAQEPWKRLQVLPGQTVVETASVEFPPVKAETRFMVQWFNNGSNVLGSTEVVAYPPNLLAELGILVNHEEGALGIFDPENQLKSSLKHLKVDFVDLENTAPETFRGKLAILGPFEPGARPLVTAQIKTLVENGVAVVWVQPRDCDVKRLDGDPQPSFYPVLVGRAAAVVVQPEMVAQLANNPRSQLNLIYFCKLALHPRPLTLPPVKRQP